MNFKSKNDCAVLAIATPDGNFIARYSEKGLAGLDFPVSRNSEKASASGDVPARIRQWHRTTVTALKRALDGLSPESLPPLDISGGTEFQQRVWSALRKIRSGQTRSYGEIARGIGRATAVRAVGGACGANPIPVLVPCHRVLAANQKLGGFSGGLNWKRTLLAREGIGLKG